MTSFVWRPRSWKQARRFVVRRDPVDPGEQLSLEGQEWHYWALVTNDGERSADELECWHRAKANVENRIKEAKLGFALDNLPSRLLHANWAYLLCTLLAYNPALLVEAARPARARAGKRCETPALPLHRRRRHGRPLRSPPCPAPLGRVCAPRRLPPSARADPRPRARAGLSARSACNEPRPLARRRSHPAQACEASPPPSLIADRTHARRAADSARPKSLPRPTSTAYRRIWVASASRSGRARSAGARPSGRR